MATAQHSKPPARYRLHWGAGYVQPVIDEIHGIEAFNHPSYSDRERRRIERLAAGATLDLSEHLPEGYTPRTIEHTVTRLS